MYVVPTTAVKQAVYPSKAVRNVYLFGGFHVDKS